LRRRSNDQSETWSIGPEMGSTAMRPACLPDGTARSSSAGFGASCAKAATPAAHAAIHATNAESQPARFEGMAGSYAMRGARSPCKNTDGRREVGRPEVSAPLVR